MASSRPLLLTARSLRAMPVPPADRAGDKEGRGCVLAVGGARQMPGALLLAAVGALRAGAGKLHMAIARSVAAMLAMEVPEAKVSPLEETRNGAIAASSVGQIASFVGDADALVLGPGMMDDREVHRLVTRLIPRLGGGKGPALVLDAAPLAVLRTCPTLLHGLRGRVVLTPHAGEMANMTGRSKRTILSDPLAAASEAARAWRAVVVLKGPVTFVCEPSGRTARNAAGNAGLGTSGSGDTLAGVIAGLLARGCGPFEGASWGAHVHARAGDALARKLGPVGYLARELLAEIPGQLAILAGHATSRGDAPQK